MRNTNNETPKVNQEYRVIRAGCSYLTEGETYRVENVSRRSLYLRSTTRGSGTSIDLWQLNQSKAGLAYVELAPLS